MARLVVLPRILAHAGPVVVAAERVPPVRVGADDRLGEPGLGQEEPVPPGLGEAGVAASEGLAYGHAVEHAEAGDRVRVVERRALGHVGAPVVADDREALVAEAPHQGDAVAGHGPLRVGLVVLGGRGLRRASVASEVRAHHRVLAGEERRDAVPGGVRARVPVQQEHGRARPAVTDTELGLADVEGFEQEVVEERHRRRGQVHHPSLSPGSVPEGGERGGQHVERLAGLLVGQRHGRRHADHVAVQATLADQQPPLPGRLQQLRGRGRVG